MACATGENVQATVGGNSTATTLHVRYGCNGKNGAKIRLGLARSIKHSVDWWLLKKEGRIFSSAGGIVKAPVIILCQPPLTTATRETLGLELTIGVAVTDVLVGDVNPIVEIPDESAGLVLHVATTVATFKDLHFLVGHTVAVGVPVVPKVEGIGNADHDAIVQR